MKRAPGRPALNLEPATEKIQVRVTSAQRLDVRRVAQENGTNVSGVMREAINEYVADYREGPRLFKKARRRR